MKSLLFLLFFSCNLAASGPRYLAAGDVDLSKVPPPPGLESSEARRDLEILLSFQSTRSPEECARGSFEAPGVAEAFFGPPYGPIGLEEALKLREFHEILHQEAKAFYRPLKRKYARLRPYESSELVSPCIPLGSSESYPSGHAASAVLSSLVYGELFPELRLDFLLRGETIADDRLLGGVHYPSDVKWGKFIGRLVFEALMKNPEFRADLEKLRP